MTGHLAEIPFSLDLVTPSNDDVLSVNELKEHRRVTWDDEDDTIIALGKAAQAAVEKELSGSLLEQTWTLRLDQFPCWEIKLPKGTIGDTGPKATLAADAVKYLDVAGIEQTLNASLYTFDGYSKPPCIYPAYGQAWPSTYPVPKAVRVTFMAGHEVGGDVPELVRTAIWLLVGDLYEHRERTITGTIVNEIAVYDRLMAQHRNEWEPRYV